MLADLQDCTDQDADTLKLQASLHYACGKLVTAVLAQMAEENHAVRIQATPQFIHAVACVVWNYLKTMAADLDAFVKHGKRTQVSVEDVKLCVRKNPALIQHLTELVGTKEPPKKRKQRE